MKPRRWRFSGASAVARARELRTLVRACGKPDRGAPRRGARGTPGCRNPCRSSGRCRRPHARCALPPPLDVPPQDRSGLRGVRDDDAAEAEFVAQQPVDHRPRLRCDVTPIDRGIGGVAHHDERHACCNRRTEWGEILPTQPSSAPSDRHRSVIGVEAARRGREVLDGWCYTAQAPAANGFAHRLCDSGEVGREGARRECSSRDARHVGYRRQHDVDPDCSQRASGRDGVAPRPPPHVARAPISPVRPRRRCVRCRPPGRRRSAVAGAHGGAELRLPWPAQARRGCRGRGSRPPRVRRAGRRARIREPPPVNGARPAAPPRARALVRRPRVGVGRRSRARGHRATQQGRPDARHDRDPCKPGRAHYTASSRRGSTRRAQPTFAEGTPSVRTSRR